MENTTLSHKSVLLSEVLSLVPEGKKLSILDCTAGGGGHFFEIMQQKDVEFAECWDRDPAARRRIEERGRSLGVSKVYLFKEKTFAIRPESSSQRFDLILADLGISSFQIDDPERGMSLHSMKAVDFRMNPEVGETFEEWLDSVSESELEKIFRIYGEEPKARKLAAAIKNSTPPLNRASEFADWIARILAYPSPSRRHPATRAFQALRIAVNDELGELEALLSWAPEHLSKGGRLLIISFHSLEDRMVKRRFQYLAESKCFDILTKRPIDPSEEECSLNPRARSAHLRVLEKTADD